MVIPPLVLVAAMQLSGPQDGQAVDAAQIPPWQDIPANVQTLAPSEIPELPSPEASDAQPHIVKREQFSDSFTSPSRNLGTSVGALPDVTTPSATLNSGVSPPPAQGSYGGYTSPLQTRMQSMEDTKLYGETKVFEDRIEIMNAIVKEDYAPIVSAPVAGTLMRLQTPQHDASGRMLLDAQGKPVWTNVRRGTVVFKDQLIANLDDRIPQAQKSVAEAKMEAAKREAEKQIEVDYAEATYETYKAIYEISLAANEKVSNAVSYAELKHQHTQCVQSWLQIEKAKYDLGTKEIEVTMQQQEINVAKTQIDLREVKAPISGMVVELTTEAGNFLREGDPLMQIVQLDKLKISGRVQYEKVDQRIVDKKRVTVKAKFPGGRTEQFDGIVRFASPVITGGREFEIEVEVANRMEDGYWLLNPGNFVDLTIHLM